MERRLSRATVRPAARPVGVLAVLLAVAAAEARPTIRAAFFEVYPSAVGSRLDVLVSNPVHCGVCHYDFNGGGPRNPYGRRLEQVLPDFPNNPAGRRQAVQFIENEDPDGDGFSTLIEVTDLNNFVNTPTFPGLSPANVDQVANVDVSEILEYLVPSTGGDRDPPDVTVLSPNGGELLLANTPTQIAWIATDESGVSAIELELSIDGGLTYRPLARGLANTGSFPWFPANRPTTAALVRVVAYDNLYNRGQDISDAAFTIASPPGGLVPTTLRDFDMPGSQPFEAGTINDPTACVACHAGYDAAVEPYFNWQGGMMSHASRDPLFEACLTIANQDAPESGDMCLRCHIPKGWLEGRSVPPDGRRMRTTDKSGVSCDFCHRMVDPIYDPGRNPPEDDAILRGLSFPPDDFGNGMFVIDPAGTRRGPFVDAGSGHPILVSPFHREAAFCGTCHDVSNPALQRDALGNYVPNAFDQPSNTFSAHALMPLERTYSEWFYSDYNTAQGVYAPQFGGNRQYVSTCQDCHMRDVTGRGCNFPEAPLRDDLPLHDLTGGSTWMTAMMGVLYPGETDPQALAAGILRARYMLTNAATLDAIQRGARLRVTVTNQTGHKLPTGYPEGRRMWLNVRFYDSGGTLVGESGRYDPDTGDLTRDAEARVYEAELGLDEDLARALGLPAGPSFHFALNNKVYKDNRIPPRGFVNADYARFGGAPAGHTYADGQYWDESAYRLPRDAVRAEVTLYYQSTSREYVEFLRDANHTDGRGQFMYDVWNDQGKSPPERMASLMLPVAPPQPGDVNCDGSLNALDIEAFIAALFDPVDYANRWPDCDVLLADMNGDGTVNSADIEGFIDALFGP